MTQTARQTLSLDSGWRFHLGDINPPLPNTHIAAYMNNKAGWARGAARGSFDDSDWREVDLPHDWSVEGRFDPSNHVNDGFLPRGIGWYRRYFRLDESDRGKRLSITFDGVATHCTVWVNGHLLHRNFCGYTPFTIDISDVAHFGETLNCIAVRVDATYKEGWWYEGAGIYRHVWLKRTSPVHVATNGVFVNPVRIDGKTWNTQIETLVRNASDRAVTCNMFSKIRSSDGGVAGEPISTALEIPARSSRTVSQTILLTDPLLWSCESPNLYELHTTIQAEGETLDEISTRFGYRTVRFDANDGFFLNDRPVRLFGTCNHQDHAGVGVAVPDSIHEFRIRRLKEMGCNAYRCAHHPPAPELLDACDRLGMLVVDENRNFGSSPEHLSQLKAMVRRDRNHPCVILWSICNEETLQGEPEGARIARPMIRHIRSLDPSRPVTAGVSGGILNDDCIAAELDVMGINYQLQTHEPFHAKHPHKPIVALENNCALSTRGIYRTDPEKFVFASDDSEKAFWGQTARETWRALRERSYVAGYFIWTGFDYRGEPSPHGWPCVSSHWGILDTCGFAKDAFYLHRAWFTSDAFVHLLPHWNWPGQENEPIRVCAYSNCDEVELFLNDELLGRKRIDPIDMAEWSVPYQPGILMAVGIRNNKPLCEARVETTGSPAALGLEVHPTFEASTVPADGAFALPVTVFACDGQSRRVPTAANFVTFSLRGPARIIGAGNGDPTCHEPDKAASRSLFNGLAQVILQTTLTPGEIVLSANAKGLKSAELRLHSTPAPFRPQLPPAPVRYFVSDWRMSPITADPPDPNQTIADTDMNTWERVNPAQGPQRAWENRSGYALYRATFAPPKVLQSSGGRIIFHRLAGEAEIFLDGGLAHRKADPAADQVEIRFPAGSEKRTLSLIVRGGATPMGLTQPVEILGL